MHFFQPLPGHVRVNLGGGNVGVAEQFLNHPQVGAVLEQVRGKAVPQHMRRDVANNPRGDEAFLEACPQRHRGESRAARGQEHIAG